MLATIQGYFAVFRGIFAIFWGAFRSTVPPRPAVDSHGAFVVRQRWGRAVARGFRCTLDVHGSMPGPGTLIVSTHSGFSDVLALFAVLPPAARANYISKVEIGRIPFVGWHLYRYRDILVDRADPFARRRVLQRAIERLRAGFSVVLFPEGTRSRTGQPAPFERIRPGLIEGALANGIPIQPLAIHDSRDLLENPLRNMRQPTKVRLYFGDVRRDFASASQVWDTVLALWQAGAR